MWPKLGNLTARMQTRKKNVCRLFKVKEKGVCRCATQTRVTEELIHVVLTGDGDS